MKPIFWLPDTCREFVISLAIFFVVIFLACFDESTINVTIFGQVLTLPLVNLGTYLAAGIMYVAVSQYIRIYADGKKLEFNKNLQLFGITVLFARLCQYVFEYIDVSGYFTYEFTEGFGIFISRVLLSALICSLSCFVILIDFKHELKSAKSFK